MFNKNNIVWFTITIYNISMAVEAYFIFYPALILAIILLASGAISSNSNSLENAFWSVTINASTYFMVGDYISSIVFFILSIIVYRTNIQKINRENNRKD